MAGGGGVNSVIAQRLEDYLTLRRGLGFKLKRQGQYLADFVAHLDKIGAVTVTTELAVAWATRPANAHPSWWGERLSAVRGFARYLASFDPTTQVPPTNLLHAQHPRAIPFLYSAADITKLVTAATRIDTPLTATNYRTLIGLLAVTGMRVGEAIRLNRDDVDHGEGLVVVRDSKFGKSRELALHPSTVAALRDYAVVRDRYWPHPGTDAWFVSAKGTRLSYNTVSHRFHELTQIAGLTPRSSRCRPRIHDLRHSFAVDTLLGWYRAGEPVQARLSLLSTYLGHVDPAATYWYLSATPELMHLVAGRLPLIGPVMP
jgi:integrase/recombinase XerD